VLRELAGPQAKSIMVFCSQDHLLNPSLFTSVYQYLNDEHFTGNKNEQEQWQ
jgi:hypothetical protein